MLSKCDWEDEVVDEVHYTRLRWIDFFRLHLMFQKWEVISPVLDCKEHLSSQRPMHHVSHQSDISSQAIQILEEVFRVILEWVLRVARVYRIQHHVPVWSASGGISSHNSCINLHISAAASGSISYKGSKDGQCWSGIEANSTISTGNEKKQHNFGKHTRTSTYMKHSYTQSTLQQNVSEMCW